MADHAAAYRGIRERVTDLTAGLDDESAARSTPACPDWRLQDVVAHLVGVNADVLAGNIDGAGSDPWTAVQVEARRDRSLAHLLAEWAECGPQLEAIMDAIPEGPRGQLIFDAMTHEFDVRGALGAPGARDSDATAIGFGWAADMIGMVRDGRDAGALCLRTEYGDQTVGSGDVTATVAADRFELYRAATGRRSLDQIAAFDWDGEVAATHVALLPARSTPLVE
jgi:uncharacterized protein (TIGR03083 family)